MGIWKKATTTVKLVKWRSSWVLDNVEEEDDEPAGPEYVYGDEMLTNTNFNTNLTGWSYTWGVAQCSEVDPYEGAKSAILMRGGGASMALYTALTTEVGATYEFSAYSKVGVANDTSVVYLTAGTAMTGLGVDNCGTSLETSSNKTTTWTKLTLVFTATATTTYISMRHSDIVTDAVLGYSSSGYFDTVSCKKRTEVT